MKDIRVLLKKEKKQQQHGRERYKNLSEDKKGWFSREQNIK